MTAGRSRQALRVLMWACLVSVVILTLLVLVGATQPIDDQLRQLFRPDDVWGPRQWRADHVVEGLRPSHMLVLICAVTAAVCAQRRSWGPLLVSASALLGGVGMVLGLKELVGRPDPHGDVISGSFPSGHTMAVMLAVGVCMLLLLGARAAPWVLTTSLVTGIVMGYALLLQGAHWASDILGGLLVALATLAWITQSPQLSGVLAPRMAGRGGQSHDPRAAPTPCVPDHRTGGQGG
jgi:hypothetical protein